MAEPFYTYSGNVLSVYHFETTVETEHLLAFSAHFSSFQVEIFNHYLTTDCIIYYSEGRSTENIKYSEARTLRNDETVALNFRERSIVGYRGVVSTWIVAEKDRCRRGWRDKRTLVVCLHRTSSQPV